MHLVVVVHMDSIGTDSLGRPDAALLVSDFIRKLRTLETPAYWKNILGAQIYYELVLAAIASTQTLLSDSFSADCDRRDATRVSNDNI